MGRHKWRRRAVLLILVCVLAVLFFAPGKKKEGRGGDDTDRKGEETIVGWMIDRIASGEVELSDEGSIRQALEEAERELEISLTEEKKDGIVGFLQTLGTIGVETDGFIEQAKEKYRQYSAAFVEEANDVINDAMESAVESAAQSFVDDIRQSIKDFFRN